jgi:hypothetical protein
LGTEFRQLLVKIAWSNVDDYSSRDCVSPCTNEHRAWAARLILKQLATRIESRNAARIGITKLWQKIAQTSEAICILLAVFSSRTKSTYTTTYCATKREYYHFFA